jgi:hypothetical protein
LSGPLRLNSQGILLGGPTSAGIRLAFADTAGVAPRADGVRVRLTDYRRRGVQLLAEA